MIARSIILFLLLILLPDLYLYRRYVGRRRPLWMKTLWWGITVAMLVYTLVLCMERNFAPTPQTPLNIYLVLLGAFTVPKALLAIATAIGDLVARRHPTRRRWGTWAGTAMALGTVYATVYGFTVGFRKLEVNRVEYSAPDLPQAFDGYRIALFSDIHVGSYTGRDSLVLKAAIDSINALKPDLVVFLGDIQNTQPAELPPHAATLSSLRATDGVLSVMGNHDYARYVDLDSIHKVANIRETERMERSFGWRLLLDEHVAIARGADTIYVAGMEGNDEIDAYFGVGNAKQSVEGIPQGVFTIMLVHNPIEWRRKVLADTQARLTLAGHTHGGQVGVAGLRPTRFTYGEDAGLYQEQGRHLYVTKGVGGLIPMRFGVTGEVVLMTLHRQTH